MQSPDTNNQFLYVELSTATDTTASFRPVLEQGYLIHIEANKTVQDVLCRQLGVAEEYLRDRVQTVFLNGKAVDDENTAVVQDGDRLALSASMPGLVGATMRKGGFFSGLRANISHKKPAKAAASKSDAFITIKLFNMIALEIGPIFLDKGIIVKGNQLQSLWDGLGEDFWQKITSAQLDGQPLDLEQIKTNVWDEPFVRLQVVSSKPANK